MGSGDLAPNWRQIFRKAFDSVNSRLNCNSRLQVGSSDVDDDNPVPVTLKGSTAELASAQDTQLATVVETYTRAEGAKQIEIYCESGSVRIRTDGVACTATTGIPLAADYAVAFEVASVSVYYVQESIITVVSR